MSTGQPPLPTRGNRLLDRLPKDEYERLFPLLTPVELAFEQVLYEFRGSIEYAYFPTGAVTSSLAVMLDGSAIEVATVGTEGLVGHTAAFGSGKTSPNKVIVQIGDGGLRIEARALRRETARGGPLLDLLDDYHTAFMAQVSQSVACNGLHRLEQRCCRWLLMTRDRVGADDLRLTHEFLAIMLGARRASVTEVLRPLQEAGLVRSHRGRISILNGAGLEERACECYRVVTDEYERLLGRPL
jgi:CRP-like cAMP-binding protein